jgi:hypothetical protein
MDTAGSDSTAVNAPVCPRYSEFMRGVHKLGHDSIKQEQRALNQKKNASLSEMKRGKMGAG